MDDYCYECTGYGDDYYYDEETHDLVCACYDCPYNDSNWEDGYWRDDIQKVRRENENLRKNRNCI